jgi:large subunit ribosomal protein L21
LYAVVNTGGKHYRVAVGDTLEVEKLPVEAGDTVELDQVLLLSSEDGVTIGRPTIEGAKVVARVTEQFRGKKLIVFKFKPKKRYRRKQGHRQSLTRIKIEEILTA